VDVHSGETRVEPFASQPEERRWVFFKHGAIVRNRDEADEVVPVVEIRRLNLNDAGDLVAADAATHVRIEEFGPNGRPLRFTQMLRKGQ
jgi:hypothetical protein